MIRTITFQETHNYIIAEIRYKEIDKIEEFFDYISSFDPNRTTEDYITSISIDYPHRRISMCVLGRVNVLYLNYLCGIDINYLIFDKDKDDFFVYNEIEYKNKIEGIPLNKLREEVNKCQQ